MMRKAGEARHHLLMTDPTKLVDPAIDGVTVSEEPAPLIKQLDIHAGILKLAIAQNDKRLVSRVLGHVPKLVRTLLDKQTLVDLATKYSRSDSIAKVLGMSPSPQISRMQDDSAIVELYAWLLLVSLLAREGKFDQIFSIIEEPLRLAQQHYTRLFDSILAKLYHHLGLASERLDRLVDLRHSFMVVLRSAALAHGTESVAVLYNWILRSYILSEQHDLAQKFVEKSPFPADANNAQVCRYHYYLARIAAVQTDYEAASDHLVQALRKAPHSDACLGLVQSANKLLVLVQLLLGIIPERSLFAQPKLAASLRPYLALAQAVRLGDLALFQKVLATHQAGFTADSNVSIVSRLHQNVLRTGLKRLNLAYSRIPLAEVARKLGLPSVEDAEFVVLKAIKDGVIEATVCHEGQYLHSQSSVNSYYTREPQATLDARIATAQDVYKASVRALRYPQAASKSSNPAADFDELVPSIDALEEAYMDDDGMDF